MYKEIIFGLDTPEQQVTDQKVYDQKLMEDTMRRLA